MRDYLEPYKKEITSSSNNNTDIVEQACLLWNIFHYVVKKYQVDHPNWIFVRHEDVSRNSVSEIKLLASKLSISFTKSMEDSILSYTNQTNSIENKRPSDIKRNSIKNIKLWKKYLSEEEIEKVRYKTRDMAEYFYALEDW